MKVESLECENCHSDNTKIVASLYDRSIEVSSETVQKTGIRVQYENVKLVCNACGSSKSL